VISHNNLTKHFSELAHNMVRKQPAKIWNVDMMSLSHCHCHMLTVVSFVSCDAAPECYNPEWEVHEDQNSKGSSEHTGTESVQECLDYCGSQSNCVAVDVDLTQQPPTCWPHFNTDDLLDHNVYSQPGTNQYRLRERCVITAGITCQAVNISMMATSPVFDFDGINDHVSWQQCNREKWLQQVTLMISHVQTVK